MKIAFDLQDHHFKMSLVSELRQLFFDPEFLNRLDSNPGLVAFTNGVWDLCNAAFRASTPEDKVSLSVCYPYTHEVDLGLRNEVAAYFEKLHPDPAQREYVLKTFARQLYGDNGSELFHIHAGMQGSAGNGKTKFFELAEYAFGDYIQKFDIGLLVCKQRGSNKPDPEVAGWRGRRFLYSTEPNPDDKLHSSIMKEKTGGEKIVFRLLFSNTMQEFRPQYKMHLMCNSPPQVDGGDMGVQRRMRMLEYRATFVPAAEADPAQHKYVADPTFIERFKSNNAVRVEFFRYVVSYYDHAFDYSMPEVVRVNSSMYLADNDCVRSFAAEYIVTDPDHFFKLKEAKEQFKNSSHFVKLTLNGKLASLKNELQNILRTVCHAQRRIDGFNETNVFMGFRLVAG
jgi:putative DNA primase/helicase